MFFFGKKKLKKAVALSNLVHKELEETIDAIYESVGAVPDLDSKDAIAQSLNSIDDCIGKMDSSKSILSEILERHGKTVSTQAEKSSSCEERNPFSFSFNERTVRCAVEQSGQALESVEELLGLVSQAAKRAIRSDDQEQLDQALAMIAEGRDKLSQVHNTLTDINKRLEQIELEALYAPPSYFGGA